MRTRQTPTECYLWPFWGLVFFSPLCCVLPMTVNPRAEGLEVVLNDMSTILNHFVTNGNFATTQRGSVRVNGVILTAGGNLQGTMAPRWTAGFVWPCPSWTRKNEVDFSYGCTPANLIGKKVWPQGSTSGGNSLRSWEPLIPCLMTFSREGHFGTCDSSLPVSLTVWLIITEFIRFCWIWGI